MKTTTALIYWILVTISHSLAAEYYVDASRPSDSGNGTTWGTAKKTIQAAVDLTTDGDTVWVADGTYDLGGKVNPGYSLTNRVCITNTITVKSLNGPDVTIIKGRQDWGTRGVYMSNGSALKGFTVSMGQTLWWSSDGEAHDLYGAGIFLTTNCIVSDCIISNNYAYSSGGGVLLLGGGTVTNCILSDNKSRGSSGGGACLLDDGLISDCLLKNNSAGDGGGIKLNNGGIVDRCILRDNYCTSRGGGINASFGGEVNNCLIFNNRSSSYAGGAYISSGSSMNNSTVLANSNDWGARVLLAYGVTLNNCIVWNNGINISETGGSSIIKYTCSPDGVMHGLNGCITNAPLFVDVENNNFKLQENSPCINSGDNTLISTPYDVDGNLRISNETVDMGAYEFSLFKILPISENVFQWPKLRDLSYSVYWTTDLRDDFLPLQTNMPWTCNSFTNLTGEAHAYFKVIAE